MCVFVLVFPEQYDAFVKFTHDQLMRRFGEQPASCKCPLSLVSFRRSFSLSSSHTDDADVVVVQMCPEWPCCRASSCPVVGAVSSGSLPVWAPDTQTGSGWISSSANRIFSPAGHRVCVRLLSVRNHSLSPQQLSASCRRQRPYMDLCNYYSNQWLLCLSYWTLDIY